MGGLVYFILEEHNGEKWVEFLRLAARPNTFRSLLSWSSKWFSGTVVKTFVLKRGKNHAQRIENAQRPYRLRRVPFCECHGVWDGEKMTHQPLCIYDGEFDA